MGKMNVSGMCHVYFFCLYITPDTFYKAPVDKYSFLEKEMLERAGARVRKQDLNLRYLLSV